jgi:DNA-binding beta-propeller fold protein YncE
MVQARKKGSDIRLALLILVAVTLVSPGSVLAKKKKKNDAPKPSVLDQLDYSKIVWPQPPSIARVKFAGYYTGEKLEIETGKKHESWMDRVAGEKLATEKTKPRFSLLEPYGMAVDSKGQLYVVDTKVGAIFIFNTETKTVDFIKNGKDAHFSRILGLSIDDNDNLFVSDGQLHHVLVFNPQHERQAIIAEGLLRPGSLAIDTENRFLYVSDVELDQVLVYDVDSHKLLRRIGTTGHKHELTSPGDFAMPGGLAVDRKGDLYVADTRNNRIEVFDAEGTFVETYGKNGDGPRDFARPKGVAIDGDGHIWVTDGALNRVQVFDDKWRLLTYMEGTGTLPGQFSGLLSITIDKMNRVFTSEMYPGRVQQFRYITDAEAAEEKARQQAELDRRSLRAPAAKPTDAPSQNAPAQKDSAQPKAQSSAAK